MSKILNYTSSSDFNAICFHGSFLNFRAYRAWSVNNGNGARDILTIHILQLLDGIDQKLHKGLDTFPHIA